MTLIKKLLHRSEFYLAFIILVFAFFVQARSGQFLTANNLVDLCVSMIVPSIFCMGMLLVVITGGIDVSFTALASLSVYVGIDILLRMEYEGSVLVAFLLVAVLSAALAALNGLFIAILELPPLIVTLGTMSVFQGILLGILNASSQNVLPEGMSKFGLASLFQVTNKKLNITSAMPYSIFLLVGIVVATWLILRHTMLGRGIYAVGGNKNAAVRMGLKVKKIKFFVYCYIGVLAGIAAVIRICMARYNPPGNMMGMEMNVIAAVVLGGASLSGGKGPILGTLLGMGLMTLMENSLLLLGVPGYWQTLFTGIIIVIGTSITSYRAANIRKRSVDRRGSGTCKKVNEI